MAAVAPEVDEILHRPHEPFAAGTLAVEPPHSIHWEQCGRPDGIPILFVHGGPGAGCSAADRRFFDPRHFRAILVDQRGAGRSIPLGETTANTPDHLVADFERLREQLGLESWHVFGGSWGSTLALYYAIRHPERCRSLVLRGIWLFRQFDLDWWLYGMRTIQPERWRAFAEQVPYADRGDLLEGYWKLLTGPDPERARAAARAWSIYEGASCTLLPNPSFAAAFATDELAWPLARLEAHYFRNCRFDPDDLLLEGVPRIRRIPAFVVHGRYDIVCPIEGADALHFAWPEADYAVVDDAGHSSREPGIARQLVAACDRIAATGDPRRRGPADAGPGIRGIDHVGLQVADLGRSLRFYRDLIGLPEIERPDLGFPGAWLRVGPGQELHLLARGQRPAAPPEERHWSIAVAGLPALVERLRAAGCVLRSPRTRADGAVQAFVSDPDGHVLELLERAPGRR